jgi:ubiquinone/menaquinone biosynthesis C-methylase UbiE
VSGPFSSIPSRAPGAALAPSFTPLFAPRPLPETWPDRAGIRLFFELFKAPFVKSGTVELPDGLPGPKVPEYVLRPFHGLPNGYYSHRVAQGYDTGFEVSMLGKISHARAQILGALLSTPGRLERVLDAGCGSGRLTAALEGQKVQEIWGLDPSPYLLQIAAERAPLAHFVQGTVEECPFADESFDAIGSCFLFHELPAEAAERGIRHLHRVLRPGGTLVIVDPCPDHLNPPSLLRLVLQHGPAALYFHFLAKGVFEPYLADWHGLGDHAAWLEARGFEVIESRVEIPFEYLIARRRPN